MRPSAKKRDLAFECVRSVEEKKTARKELDCSLKRQTIHLLRDIEARSRNYFCRGKAISITYSECRPVSVALIIQHAMRMHHIIPGC